MAIRRYAALKAQEHTVGPGWPIMVRLACKALGASAMVARIPSVLFGSATVLAIFFLVYYVLLSHGKRPFWPASFAAFLTAISIPQIDFSQRAYPYATIPFLTTLIVLLHLEMVKVIQKDQFSIEKFSIVAFLYAAVCGLSIFLHMSFVIVILSSFICFFGFVRQFLKLDRQNQVAAISISALVVLSVMLVWMGNYIHLSPKQGGYRPYLSAYYHRFDSSALFFIFTRTYDAMTYNLNLFYNHELYWPRQLNAVLLPLVGLCVFGWVLAAIGKFGRVARHLSLMAAVCFFLPGVLSLLKKYPFGGTRQTVFIVPFLLTFTAMGFYKFIRSAKMKPIGVVVVVAYMILWAINLPSFYQERVIPFDSKELLKAWEQSGKFKIYTLDNCKDSIKYRLHRQPEVEVQNLPLASLPNNPPFLIVSTHWAIEDDLWRPRLKEEIKESRYTINLLMKRAAKYPAKREYIQSLYWPPNGLWVYKITTDEKP